MGFRHKQVILRAAGDSEIVDGMVVNPSYKTLEIMASVQPLNNSEAAQYTKANGNGEFTASMVKLYTDEPLLTSKQVTEQGNACWPDYVWWQGRYWKVIMCSAYQSGVISHYKSIAQEVDFDGNIGLEEVPAEPNTDGTGSDSDMGESESAET